MKHFRLVGALGALAVAALIGCTEPSVAPAPTAPNADLFGTTLSDLSLLSCSPLAAVSETQEIGPDGGLLRIGPHSLWIPPGALDTTVAITAEVPSDTINRVHFEPEGLTFNRPASLTLSYANCSFLGTLLPKRVVYMNDALEILQLVTSLDNFFTRRVTGRITHFSDYAIAW